MFVAPAYPRAATDARIQGRTSTQLTVNREGLVTEAKTILAHPVFKSCVLQALRQWRFMPSNREHTFQVTCVFELAAGCEGTPQHPVTPETHVSAELPTVVHIMTGFQCMERDDSQQRHWQR
ncbi:MAG: TonB family protein [Bryobacteraceae bacterium]